MQDGALVSVITPLRRCAILVTFLGAIAAFKEKNFRPKFACILVLLAGVWTLNRK